MNLRLRDRWLPVATLGLLLIGSAQFAMGCDPTTFMLLAPSVLKNLDNDDAGTNFTDGRDLSDLRTRTVELINDAREREKLPKLSMTAALNTTAQRHCTDMVASDFVGHRGSDGSGPETRVRDGVADDWDYLGENVTAGWPTVRDAFEAFMDNDDNRRNILAPEATQIGVGYAFGSEDNEYPDGAYVTILFFDPLGE